MDKLPGGMIGIVYKHMLLSVLCDGLHHFLSLVVYLAYALIYADHNAVADTVYDIHHVSNTNS